MSQNVYSKVQTENANLKLAYRDVQQRIFMNFSEFVKNGKIHEFLRILKR